MGKAIEKGSVLALSLAAFVLYLLTLSPGVLDGDSGEWQYMANILGVAHSTGYPLYLLLGKLFTLIPIGSAAWRVNLLSAVCAAAAVGIIYLLAFRIVRSRLVAAVAAALMAVAPTLWASAVEAEVYALNTLLIALTIYFAVRWYQDKQPRDLYLMALMFGLSLDNHRIAAFAAFGFILLVWFMRRVLSPRRVIIAALLVVTPLLLYAYIPIRASQIIAAQSPAATELYPRGEAYLKGTISAYYNHTPQGLLALVTGLDNRNKLGFENGTGGDSVLARVENSATLLLQQFNPLVILLALVGVVLAWRRDRALTLVLLTIAAGIGAISVTLRAESTRFYFSGAYLILALFFAIAAAAILEGLGRSPRLRILALAALVLVPVLTLGWNYPSMDASSNHTYENYARSILADHLAPNAVVIAPWEIVTGLRYYQLVEGQRPDVLFIHESPIRPQYAKLETAAHALKRPFYYVQFTPEDRNASGPRTVQAVGLPLLDRPAPHYALNQPLNDSVSVIGYDLAPDPARQNQFLRLAIYYAVTGPVGKQYKAGLDWSDIRGEPHGDWEHMPVSDYQPTYLWQPGDYYRDVWDIPVTAEMPSGLYSFQLNWYAFDPTTNATDYDHPGSVALGPVRVGDFNAGAIRNPQHARFENGMELLGYDVAGSENRSIQPGQKLDLSLYWSAVRRIQKGYTVFVHLEDSSGVVRAQADRAPWDGLYPTDRWTPGETVRDHYSIDLPNDLALGEYRIRVGLYQTPDARVPLVEGGDQVTLNTNFVANGK